jgi:hypothetical protein
MSAKKIILFAILVTVLAAATIGYKMYNKKHFSVESAAPVAEITAIDLLQIFVADSTLAKNKYIGDESNHKVVQVSGVIKEITKNQLQQIVLKLKTSTDGAFINCEMEGKVGSNTAAGNNIILKGICDGYLYEADFGIPGDVNFKRCFIIKE